MRTMRGYSYLEVLGATALLGIALLASGGLLLQWHHASQALERRAVAEHALAQEMDFLLARSQAPEPGTRSWSSGADRASGLPAARGELRVERFGERGLRRVAVHLRWEGGEAVRETLLGGRP